MPSVSITIKQIVAKRVFYCDTALCKQAFGASLGVGTDDFGKIVAEMERE